MRAESERRLTVETCDTRERDMRDRLQRQMDNETGKIDRLRDKIVNAMTAYNQDYPTETREVDVAIEAAAEYRKMLAELESDGLPGSKPASRSCSTRTPSERSQIFNRN